MTRKRFPHYLYKAFSYALKEKYDMENYNATSDKAKTITIVAYKNKDLRFIFQGFKSSLAQNLHLIW